MASHVAIEANPLLSLLTSDALTEDTYKTILKRYYGFFRPLENALRASEFAASVVPDLPAHFKSSELTEDLLGFGFTGQEIEQLQFCSSLPPMTTRALLLGVMYVMEGSALGGLMIAKHLAARSFYTPARGSFFHSDPKGVSSRWKDFLLLLETVPASEHPETVTSAIRTFDVLDRWMAEGSPTL